MTSTSYPVPLVRVLGVAALAGVRSMSPLALISLFLGRRPDAASSVAGAYLAALPAQVLTTTMAIGELVGDKLPGTPDRTFPPALVFRALTGGSVAAVLASLTARPILIDGIGGALAAVGSTFLTLHTRRWLGCILPEPWSGVVEDVALWAGGWWLLSSMFKRQE